MKQFIEQIFEKTINNNKPMVFFDRDGVITKKSDFILHKKEISFYKSAIKAIQLLNSYKFPVVVVTNQPGVARGLITESDLLRINEEIIRQLKQNHAFINAIYSCPHHPEANLPNYRIRCLCRKPGTLLIKEALKQFKTNTSKCYFIGDQTIDIQAGKDVGAKTFLVKTGYGGKDKRCEVTPDYVCKNTLEAVKIILKDFNL